MKREVVWWIGIIIVIGLFVALLGLGPTSILGSHTEGPVYQLTGNATGINTSIGVIDIPYGALLNGDPFDFITFSESVLLQTDKGEIDFHSGDKIDCYYDPYSQLNPCTKIYQLSANATNISTSNGFLNLTNGTFVGGNPPNYIVIDQTVSMQTTEGEIEFEAFEKINCDHEPGQPDPCESA